MMDQRIMMLSQAAREIFKPSSTDLQRQANQTFEQLTESPDNLQLILELLENGEQPYAQYCASITLKKLSEKRINIQHHEQLQLANQLLAFMANRANSIDVFTLGKLSDVYANLCKFNFHFKDSEKQFPFRDSLTDVQNALKNVDVQGTLALKLLICVIAAFDEQKMTETNTEHRIAHNEFQNKFLREFNNIAIDQLVIVVDKMKRDMSSVPWDYIKSLLSFYKKLLEFEFLGSSFDVEERETVDIPASWRLKTMLVYEPVFELFRLIPATEVNCLVEVLSIAGSIASVRRTLYDCDERSKIIDSLLNGVAIVLNDVSKLGTPQIFVEFTRLLYRINRNFTFSDLAKCNLFVDTLLPLLSQFSCQAFEAFDNNASNGTFYLLAFWQRIAIHAPSKNSTNEEDRVYKSIEPIPQAFVTSRMELCGLASVGEAESPFDDKVSIAQFMEHFAGLCRMNLPMLKRTLTVIFKESTDVLLSYEPGSQMYLLAELKLIYWTYIVGACLDVREVTRTIYDEETPEEVDIDLFVKITETSKYNMERLQSLRGQEIPDNVIQLELALLTAYDKFRVAYLNESSRYYTEIQEKLIRRLQLDSSTDAMWELYVDKIFKNIQLYGSIQEIIQKTLQLFSSLSSSITIAKKIWNLKTTQYILGHHDGNTFPFLESSDSKTLRCRSDFYCSLMRVVMVGIDSNEIAIDEFMKPIDVRTQYIAEGLQHRNVSEQQLKYAVAGLARDYKGLVESCSRTQPYSWLTGFCHHKVYNIFYVAIQRFADDPVVTVAILKCLTEFCTNRNARLAFNLNHYRSTAIFVEVAKIVQAFCSLFVQFPVMDVNAEQFSSHRMKIVTCLLLLTKQVLNGNYLPIALLYRCNDATLKNMLDSVFGIFRLYAVTAERFPKAASAFIDVAFEIGRSYPAYASKMEINDLVMVFHYLEHGVHSSERSKLMNACTTFERLTDLLLEQNNRKKQLESVFAEPIGDSLNRCFEQQPKVLENFFSYFMNMIVNDARPLHYMAGRVLYNTIFLRPQIYPMWKIEHSTQFSQQILDEIEEILTTFLSKPFSTEDREIFTVKIEHFQTQLKDPVKFETRTHSMDQ